MVYNCFWPSAAQQFSSSSFAGRPYLTVSDSKLPQTGGPGTRIYIPQEQGGRVISRLVLLITFRHRPRRKHRFPFLLYRIFAEEICLFAKPLLSKGCLCWLHSSCLDQIRSHSVHIIPLCNKLLYI
jgi:hypothetical protein